MKNKSLRIRTTNKFVNSEGKYQVRATSIDFETLPIRHLESIHNLPGFMDSKKLIDFMGKAMRYYQAGWYSESLDYLIQSLEIMPELNPYIFYYIRVCERVLAINLTDVEERYEEKRKQYRSRLESLPRWLWWIVPKINNRIRCKWCGRYTDFIHPDVPTFGFANDENSCDNCGGMYPMPSWMWDSPDGRAYSYYRMSFPPEEDQFYNDFLSDYSPDPLNQYTKSSK